MLLRFEKVYFKIGKRTLNNKSKMPKYFQNL